ncbi:hypothetical protein COT44_03205 [Candidatus Shapirobacteria bacterium CG08_land_8_20_14_0_20_39_18]|uniref:SH3b domain-containing protein n=1 Tax=Candidatus Shapirobacteria bacterium CG08_land_8_20_14_0_20_39_18 TaxID=1974883 RepID=A0A2M6XCR3_9BACT|nr:MAG: hypothetical protein COT44_03205 [Candidatus Shapirobacteria bacterium CG08_land_8_20_14_0_20_39_18]
MKKFILPVLVIMLVIVLAIIIFKSPLLKQANAGLQVNSIPQASVYLDNKEVGKTPYEEAKLTSGEKTVKLVLSTIQWEAKVKLNNGTVAVVSYEFGADLDQSTGEIITLEPSTNKKSSSLTVVSQPDSSVVKVDGETKGFTPVLIENLSTGQHEIVVSAPDFKDRTITTKFFGGFKTMINVKLASAAEGQLTPTPEPSGPLTPTPTSGKIGKATPTPSTTLRASPTPTGKTTPTPLPKPYVKILDTPTGWLRVRMKPSLTASEAARVNPGEQYSLLDQQTGWYQISYDTNKEGWISSQYAQKFE